MMRPQRQIIQVFM
nr:unnamed protein product [Callosobruchus analis]